MHEAYNNLTAAFQFLLCFNVFSTTSLCLSLRLNCPEAWSFKVGQGYVFSTGYFQNDFLDDCSYFCNNRGAKMSSYLDRLTWQFRIV